MSWPVTPPMLSSTGAPRVERQPRDRLLIAAARQRLRSARLSIYLPNNQQKLSTASCSLSVDRSSRCAIPSQEVAAMRRRKLLAAVVALSAVGLLAQDSAFGAAAPTARTAAAPASGSAPSTGSSAVVDLGAAGWKVLTSATATQGGAQISTPGFSTSGWLSVTNDGAGAPGTEINALLQNGACPNVFFSTNMKTCFGQMTKVGADTIAQFSVPWWYRTDFAAPPAGQNAKLIVNGVVGKADVWVNGTEIASAATVAGAYPRYAFDITSHLVTGANSLAIEVYPNNPNTMLTLDNVDWTQIPPDNNTGIQFPVQLQSGGPLVAGNAHVNQNTAVDLSSSALTVKTDITNTSATSQTGLVSATVTPPAGSPVTVSQNVTVPANATQTVSFMPAAFPGPDHRGPADLVALPAGRAAALHARDVGVPERYRAQLDQWDLRHPHRDLVPDRCLVAGSQRGARLQNQQRTPRHPRWWLRPGSVPALLPVGHRQADRADESLGREHDPARGTPHAG